MKANVSLEAALAAVDSIADKTFEGFQVPGLAYGVVAGDRLVHSRGLGTLRVGEDATPDADSVFRISSMTKSFTAATVLLLRDEGRLRLDDAVADHVPELAAVRGPTADSPPITIRHLLTMSAGLPADDPWGDRQQGLALTAFSNFLRGGISFAWAPGLRFQYSNLGYAILGRLITNVAGKEYREVVADRLLRPLGMTSTGYVESVFPASRLARGYVFRDDTYADEPSDPYGAFASMGGLFSTVRDLSRWVAGFTDAFPPRDDPEGGHPLRRASRREMQQRQQQHFPMLMAPSADAPPEYHGGAYGFGLIALDDLRFGRIITHHGGYPGYGSNMRWHPASGLGVIVLANGRYAPTQFLAMGLLDSLLASDAAPARRVQPAVATQAARATVERMLERWDGETMKRLCAMNVELDEPLARRRETFEKLRTAHGRLEPDPDETPESSSPLELGWWMRGERGRVRVEIQLTPEKEPRVQTLNVASVPEPPARLAEAATRITNELASRTPAWPSSLALRPELDADALDRSLRAAAARFGPISRTTVVGGDGETFAAFRLAGKRGAVELQLARDPATGVFMHVALVPEPLMPPSFAD